MQDHDRRKIAAFYDRLEQQDAPEERDTGTVLSARPLAGCVLDIGCGTGALLAEVRRLAPAARPFGVDISPGNVGSTLARAIPAAVSSADRLPFPDTCFDVVFFMEVYEHLLRRAEALAEIRRVLKVAGTLVMSVPNRWWPLPHIPYLNRHYVPVVQPIDAKFSHAELTRALVRAGFSVTRRERRGPILGARFDRFLFRLPCAHLISKRVWLTASKTLGRPQRDFH